MKQRVYLIPFNLWAACGVIYSVYYIVVSLMNADWIWFFISLTASCVLTLWIFAVISLNKQFSAKQRISESEVAQRDILLT